MNPAYEISAIEDSIVIRLSRSQTDEAFLKGLLDYLEFETTRRRSAISDDESSQLSSDIREKELKTQSNRLFPWGWLQ